MLATASDPSNRDMSARRPREAEHERRTKAGGVDDGTSFAKAFAWLFRVVAHSDDGILQDMSGNFS